MLTTAPSSRDMVGGDRTRKDRLLTDDATEMDVREEYERRYGALDEEEPRARGPRRQPAPVAVADADPGEGELPMTYKAGRFEQGWLTSSLRPFYHQQLITDVLCAVRGGKEASVYCCRPGPGIDPPLLAAKVYRPRQFRNLRNDGMYREGRPILTSAGRPVKKSDSRIMRAVGKKTAFGVQVSHTSWLMYEYTSLERLHAAGGAVPKPIGASENAILMEYCGDAHGPAPALSQVHLQPQEAVPLLAEAMRNVELMLQHGIIHGDLSAYNLLYWQGRITLIDFPQMTDLAGNPNAALILRRDIARVCEYFAAHGAACDADALFDDLWERYAEE